jgi:ABC-2 type transport system ATP-binding protein
VTEGTIFALLGPNGAGKTTIVRILSTLIPADSGDVQVAGHDVVDDPDGVRASIGVTGQFSAVDELLTGKENLQLMADLNHLGRLTGRARVDELLARFDLVDAAARPVSTYSGGMRRRLDLAMTLIGSPRVIFLDEPTTGLDPQSRRQLWELIAGFRAAGRTVILTTHYMEEAERLCDRVAIVDHGRIIALGTPRELVASLGAEQMIEITLARATDGEALPDVCKGIPRVVDARHADGTLSLRVFRLHETLPRLLEALATRGVVIEELRTHAPTLEDVFVALTGRHLRDG